MKNPPPGFSLLPSDDDFMLIKSGDLLWHEDNADWQEAERGEIGDNVNGYYGVARRDSQSK